MTYSEKKRRTTIRDVATEANVSTSTVSLFVRNHSAVGEEVGERIAEAIRKLGDQYSRTRLTPFVKSAFQKWLSWTR